jgi:hypothetical protein
MTRRACQLLAVLLAASFPVGGCLKQKLTLREAEGLADSWLEAVGDHCAPAHKAPAATENAADEKKPKTTLRDCFVDDGWSPEGFKNPTEAISWLEAQHAAVGRVTSINVLEKGDGAEVSFELHGAKGSTPLVARVVDEEGVAKCNRLEKAKAQASP